MPFNPHGFSADVVRSNWLLPCFQGNGRSDDSLEAWANRPHFAVQTRQGGKWGRVAGRDELQLWNSTLIPLLTLFRPASLFSFSLLQKKERIEGEKGGIVQNGPSWEHFQRKYEILQLQNAV